MDIRDVKNSSLKLMETSKAAFLTTIDSNGFPITRAIFNLRNREQFPKFTEFFNRQTDKFVVYISTNTSSSKVDHIKSNPAICVYYCDTDNFYGIMLGGFAEIVNNLDIKHVIWLDWWKQYYKKGVEDPDYTLLKLHPKYARYYHNLNLLNFELVGE